MSINFYELYSFLPLDAEYVLSVLSDNKYSEYRSTFSKIQEITLRRFRQEMTDEEWDYIHREAPEELVLKMLENYEQKFYLCSDDYLRSYRFLPMDTEMTALDAYKKFGKAIIEAQEFGSVNLDNSS